MCALTCVLLERKIKTSAWCEKEIENITQHTDIYTKIVFKNYKSFQMLLF